MLNEAKRNLRLAIKFTGANNYMLSFKKSGSSQKSIVPFAGFRKAFTACKHESILRRKLRDKATVFNQMVFSQLSSIRRLV